MEREDGCVWCVLVDLTPAAWSQSSHDLNRLLEALSVTLHAFVLLHRDNRFAVVATLEDRAEFIIAPTPETSASRALESLTARLGQTLTDFVPRGHGCNLFRGLSLCLCYANSFLNQSSSLKARILVIKVSPDDSSSYVSTMNCIFAAQSRRIRIDSCVLSEKDSVLLQQASHATHGIYMHVSQQDFLLHHLMTSFLLDESCREFICAPKQQNVDYSATCFCHHQLVSRGFVCPVCLSVFCKPNPTCPMCKSRFPPELKRKVA